MTTSRHESDWLSLAQEEPLEPELPIIDPHHHFWDRPNGNRYLLDELAADVSGHNVRQTVLVECSSMYRAAGAEEFRVEGRERRYAVSSRFSAPRDCTYRRRYFGL